MTRCWKNRISVSELLFACDKEKKILPFVSRARIKLNLGWTIFFGTEFATLGKVHFLRLKSVMFSQDSSMLTMIFLDKSRSMNVLANYCLSIRFLSSLDV